MENKKKVEEFRSIKELLYASVEKYKEHVAFVIKHQQEKKVTYEEVTYSRLLENVNQLGTALYARGFQGKRIAIIGKNRYEWAVAHLSNLFGGIVSVPLDKDLQLEELENSLIRSKSSCIIFDEKLTDKIAQIKKNQKTELTQYICMSESEDFPCVKELIEQGKQLIEQGDKSYLEAKIDENAMNILLFTSGTTSQSKAVMLSQRNIASNIYAMQCVEDIRDTDVNIAFLPFHHIFGSTCLIMMLACGVKTVFPDGLRYIKENLKEYKVTIFVGVPVLIEAIYKTIMKEIQKQGKTKAIKLGMAISRALLKCHIDIRRKLFKPIIEALGGELRFVISGGAPADPKISKGFNDLGIKTVQGYGLSETYPVIAAENENLMKNGSVGVPKINDTNEIVKQE